jgi:hypothetical protein
MRRPKFRARRSVPPPMTGPKAATDNSLIPDARAIVEQKGRQKP